MIQADFWQDVPPMNVGAYIDAITLDSEIAASPQARDCEVQLLAELALVGTGMEQPEAQREASQSRVQVRRNVLGEWSDDHSPFTDDEIKTLRQQAWRVVEAMRLNKTANS
ncbi:MAG: hypothetical protein OXH86_05905 [Acidimicrobiaceae bacterium]|nr:hypothetical protein [Acidimicrobiaceae bacterium]MDE0496867.1 hypothetical protein [Acidimicrobiaceae bacterium]